MSPPVRIAAHLEGIVHRGWSLTLTLNHGRQVTRAVTSEQALQIAEVLGTGREEARDLILAMAVHSEVRLDEVREQARAQAATAAQTLVEAEAEALRRRDDVERLGLL